MNAGNETVQKAGGALGCAVRTAGELSGSERERMFALMADYYENVERDVFERDLAEKEWVIVMTDASRGIMGFTTLMRLRAEYAGEPLVALYSGDTVLDPEIWGAGGWARAWGRLAAELMQEMHPQPLYWLLLTATHRTYRFLPTCFKEYYPSPGKQPASAYRGRLEALVSRKFGDKYDAARGIVRTDRPLLVRPERIEMATAGLDEDYAAFFALRNPGHLQGDYLVCITDLSHGNRTRHGDRLFSLRRD